MTNAAVRTAHLKDTTDLYDDIDNDWLPAVSIVKPSGLRRRPPGVVEARPVRGVHQEDRRRASSAIRSLWKDTAIFVTFDEGGGYYDSGYIQPVDFFGDGTRIPMIVVSPLRHRRPHLARVRRPRLDPEVHRAQLGPAADHAAAAATTCRTRSRARATRTRRSTAPRIGDLFDLFDFAH